MTKFFCFLLLFIFNLSANSQMGEFVVSFDHQTALYNRLTGNLGPLSIMASSAYDREQKRFFFIGKTNANFWTLYVVNTQTGNVDGFFNQFTPANPYVSQLEYDNSTDTLYGISCNGSLMPAAFDFVWIDPSDGSVHIKNSISNLSFIPGYESAYDEQNRRFMFVGKDLSNQQRLYVINANTGNLVASHAMPGINLFNLAYNNLSQRLYAIVDSVGWTGTRLDSIQPSTGARKQLLPLGDYAIWSRQTVAVDEPGSRYIFVARTITGMADSIYSINLTNHTFASRVAYPYDPSGQSGGMENVLGYCFDEENNTIYAMHWGNTTDPPLPLGNETEVNPELQLFPNPTTGSFTITAPEEILYLSIFDETGREVLCSRPYSRQVLADLRGYSCGIYTLKITTGTMQVSRKVILKE